MRRAQNTPVQTGSKCWGRVRAQIAQSDLDLLTSHIWHGPGPIPAPLWSVTAGSQSWPAESQDAAKENCRACLRSVNLFWGGSMRRTLHNFSKTYLIGACWPIHIYVAPATCESRELAHIAQQHQGARVTTWAPGMSRIICNDALFVLDFEGHVFVETLKVETEVSRRAQRSSLS